MRRSREVDVVCLLVEATAPIGRGDRFIAELVQQVDTPTILVVNKVDAADRRAVAEHLAVASAELGDFDAYVPLSARTGDGVDALVGELEARLPEGPQLLPRRRRHRPARDVPRRRAGPREAARAPPATSCPHSITVVAEEIEPDDARRTTRNGEPDGRDPVLRIRVRVRVERDSQKGIVIGRGGAVLKEAGTEARRELEALLGTRVYLETTGQGRARLAARAPTRSTGLGF